MEGGKKVPVGDAHAHSNPARGMGAREIARRFRRSGGWFIALLSLNPWSYGIEPPGYEAYMKVVDLIVSECRRAREEGLKVKCFSGFHPADVDRLIDRYRLRPEEVLQLGLRVVRALRGMCRDGVIDGIGEVGRQHYRTAPERVAIASLIMEEALEATEDGCMIQLHLEQAGRATIDTVDMVVRRLGVKARETVIFHHSTLQMATRARELGYNATVPGVPKMLDYAADKAEPIFMIESDFIDDPRRPGVVVYPWLMAEKLSELATKGYEEWAWKVAVENVSRVFGVEPP